LQFYPDYQKDIAVSLWMYTVYMRIIFPDAKDRLHLGSISYAIRGTNAIQKTTKQAEQSIRPTT